MREREREGGQRRDSVKAGSSIWTFILARKHWGFAKLLPNLLQVCKVMEQKK